MREPGVRVRLISFAHSFQRAGFPILHKHLTHDTWRGLLVPHTRPFTHVIAFFNELALTEDKLRELDAGSRELCKCENDPTGCDSRDMRAGSENPAVKALNCQYSISAEVGTPPGAAGRLCAALFSM